MHDIVPGFVVREEPSNNLLDLRNHGWVLEQSWPKLFNLYTRDGEARVELSPELSAIETAHLQGYSVGDKGAASIKGALAMSAMLHQVMEDGDYGSSDFHHAKKLVSDRFVSEFGGIIRELLKSETSDEAKGNALAATNLMRRATAALVRAKFPKKGRGNPGVLPKALLILWHARGLCEHYRRLPTKREIRARLEAVGINYARSKDPDLRWAELFASAGLASLPE
jgi:hypothetical protein